MNSSSQQSASLPKLNRQSTLAIDSVVYRHDWVPNDTSLDTGYLCSFSIPRTKSAHIWYDSPSRFSSRFFIAFNKVPKSSIVEQNVDISDKRWNDATSLSEVPFVYSFSSRMNRTKRRRNNAIARGSECEEKEQTSNVRECRHIGRWL
jgi:hypothetical protein